MTRLREAAAEKERKEREEREQLARMEKERVEREERERLEKEAKERRDRERAAAKLQKATRGMRGKSVSLTTANSTFPTLHRHTCLTLLLSFFGQESPGDAYKSTQPPEEVAHRRFLHQEQQGLLLAGEFDQDNYGFDFSFINMHTLYQTEILVAPVFA